MTLLFACIAAAVVFHAYISSGQFVTAYFALHEFDLPATGFITTALFFMLPFWLTGALIIRAIVQRTRLAWWAHKAFTFAEYQTGLRPAEAGLIVDSEFNYKELAATFLDLHFRQAVHLTVEENGSLSIQKLSFDPRQLTYYENYLLELLFLDGSTHVSVHLRESRLATVFKEAHITLIEQLTASGKLPREVLPGATLKTVFRVLYGISAFVGVGSFLAYVDNPEAVSSVVYPRYPVVPAQLWVLGGVLVVCVLVALSGFWPRFTRNGKSPYQQTWMEVAGLLLFMRVVYKDRFAAGNLHYQDSSSIRAYVPYAIAFGLIHPTTQNLSRILELASDQKV